MSRSSALILLGVLTMLTPLSGLPSGFRTFLTLVFGLAVAALGVFMRAADVRASASAAPAPEPAPLPEAPETPPPPAGVSPI